MAFLLFFHIFLFFPGIQTAIPNGLALLGPESRGLRLALQRTGEAITRRNGRRLEIFLAEIEVAMDFLEKS